MQTRILFYQRRAWLVFLTVFMVCVAAGGLLNAPRPAAAANTPAQALQQGGFAGSEACKKCHETIHTDWMSTRHAQAFSSPIFQRDWTAEGSQASCLSCHTTGFDPVTGTYSEKGVTCESCHGPLGAHPAQPMELQPNAELCSTCHKSTTDEWRASKHAGAGVQCQNCHNPHSQTPKAATITELCANCHKERGASYTHGTHSSAGLECSNCHMYRAPRTQDPIQGLVPTGHTFFVGSDACIGCHQDTVHTRDQILKLSGEVAEVETTDIDTLKKQLSEQEEKITSLQSQSAVRLYTGLIQGAIIGLITGAVAAWVVSQRVRFIEVENE